MKKNLALFMAAMMAMTAVPVTSVFANDVSITVADNFAKEKDTAYNGKKVLNADGTWSTEKPISYFLDVKLDDFVEKDSQFIVELTGAKFTNVLEGDLKNVSYFSDDDSKTKDSAPVLGGKENEYTANKINGDGTFDSVATTARLAAIDKALADNNAAVTKALSDATTALTAAGITAGPASLSTEDLGAIIAYLKANPGTKLTLTPISIANMFANILTQTARSAILETLNGYKTTINTLIASNIQLMNERNAITGNGGDIGEGDATNNTSPVAFSAMFANAGLLTTGDGTDYTAWTNINYTPNNGATSSDEGVVVIKKLSDTRFRATFTDDVIASDGAKKMIRIPLPITINADADTVTADITQSSGNIPKKSFMLVDTAASGTTTHSDIAKGREIIELETIKIDETTVGVLERGSFELLAPDGYRFRNKIQDIGIKASGDATFEIVEHDNDSATNNVIPMKAGTNAAWTDDDNTSIAIAVDITAKSSKLPGTIEVSGLVIEPIDDDAIVDGEELFMTIRDYTEDAEDAEKDYGFAPSDNGDDDSFYDGDDLDGIGVSKEDFKVADSVDWGVTLTAASVKDLTAGRWAKDADDAVHATAEITISETEDDTWRATRTTEFTLPEGVEIRGVNIKSVDGFDSSLGSDADARDEVFALEATGTGTPVITDAVGDLGMDGAFGVVTKTDFKDSIVSIDENVMTWKNIDSLDEDAVSKVTFVLYLSIAPTYAEDTIELQLGGTAIDDKIDPVTIANVKHPITVTTKPTDVQIGYQRFTVADIVIEENFAGAILEADSGLVISMDNDKAKGLELVDVGEVTVEGDIRLSDVSTDTNKLSFDVIRASSKTPSTITLSDVEVYVDRTVPYGTYSVEVGGESVFANVEGGALDNNDDDNKAVEDSLGTSYVAADDDGTAKFARFADGFKSTYINLATEGSNTPLKDHVVISAGSAVALVDGKEVTMTDVVPYRTDAEGNSFMVPVRFASEIFGVKSENLLWDNASKTATILLDGGRIIQFVGGTDYYTVNGAKVQMLTGTTPVYTEIDPAAERMYVPFRHLGRAFGIADADITYDEATETAQYNQPRE